MIYEFAATQSYNGYDKPWAGGTNVNQYNDIDMKYGKWFAADGTLIDGVYGVVTDFIPVDGPYLAIKYYGVKPYSCQICSFADDKTTLIDRWTLTGTGLAGTSKALPENAAYVRIGAAHPDYLPNPSKAVMTPEVFYSLQLMFITDSDTFPDAYTPYTNVCMPEGFNIWDPVSDQFVQVYAGYVNANTRELYLRPVYPEYAGEELVGPWMSSLDLYDEDTTPAEGAFVIDFGGELESFEITPFMLQTLLDSLGIRQHFTNGAGLLNSLMDQAQGRVRSEEELLHLSRPLKVIAIGDQLPAGITFKPISKDVLPGLPGKFIR